MVTVPEIEARPARLMTIVGEPPDPMLTIGRGGDACGVSPALRDELPRHLGHAEPVPAGIQLLQVDRAAGGHATRPLERPRPVRRPQIGGHVPLHGDVAGPCDPAHEPAFAWQPRSDRGCGGLADRQVGGFVNLVCTSPARGSRRLRVLEALRGEADAVGARRERHAEAADWEARVPRRDRCRLHDSPAAAGVGGVRLDLEVVEGLSVGTTQRAAQRARRLCGGGDEQRQEHRERQGKCHADPRLRCTPRKTTNHRGEPMPAQAAEQERSFSGPPGPRPRGMDVDCRHEPHPLAYQHPAARRGRLLAGARRRFPRRCVRGRCRAADRGGVAVHPVRHARHPRADEVQVRRAVHPHVAGRPQAHGLVHGPPEPSRRAHGHAQLPACLAQVRLRQRPAECRAEHPRGRTMRTRPWSS